MSSIVAGGSPDSSRRRGRTYDDEKSLNDDESSRIKPEPDSDIKDYAETTMNELLGWYGLDKLDTRGLNLNHHFPTSSSSSSPVRHDMSEEELSQSPHIESESIISNPSTETIICAWCLKTGLKLFTLKTSSGKTKVFCSEPCFNQCRRAAFKKNRVCNWCRHVRHTVNYVDFKDGDEQLQFCSDKCLNQYKMQIFCRETQAYLQMNPHLQEETSKNAGTANSKLITPDLWLRDCQEAANGNLSARNLSHSDDDSPSPSVRTVAQSSGNEMELEDLSVKNRTERSSSNSLQQRDYSNDIRKSTDSLLIPRDKRSNNLSNALSSYLREDKDKNALDRKKRYFDSDREHYRKKQRVSNLRHRMNHQQEAPPAHSSSSVHPSMPFQNQSRLFQPSASTYLPPSINSSVQSLNPPAAHSKSIPHLPMSGSLLPPPPPLLNSDYLHSQFNPQLFQSPLNSLSHQQQQLETILRMQSTMARRTESFSPHMFPESPLPSSLRASSPPFNSGTSLQPNTVMLPYPIFLPLPVPIPIPIPLSCFLRRNQKHANPNDRQEISKDEHLVNGDKVDKMLSDDKTNSVSKKYRNDLEDLTTKKEKTSSSSYAVTNNDSQTNRLILTRNKPR